MPTAAQPRSNRRRSVGATASTPLLTRAPRVLTGIFLAAMVLAACGGDAEEGTTTTSLAATTTALATTTTTTTAPTTTTTAVTTTAAPPAATTVPAPGDLPGEPIDFGPAAGDTLGVIGVAHDDVLNLRAAPGADQQILDGVPPLHDALTALGETRELPGSFWIAVEFEGTEGWVNLRYVGYLGDTTDETAAVVSRFGEAPGAETMLDLGFIVADSMASEEPESDIVLVVAPSVGDLGEVTYDVIGLGDDALRGLRVHVFGTPIDEGFVLDAVEVTLLCGRGVDGGACV